MRLFTGNDGIRVGTVTAIVPRDDHVWVGGESGVMRYDGARFLPLAVASGPLLGVTGIVETADGDLWLNAVGGVRHVRAAEIQSAMRDPRFTSRATSDSTSTTGSPVSRLSCARYHPRSRGLMDGSGS